MNTAEWTLLRQRQGDGSTPCPHIYRVEPVSPPLPNPIQHRLNKFLGFGARNQHALIYREFKLPKRSLS
jgi:hypothetical protein